MNPARQIFAVPIVEHRTHSHSVEGVVCDSTSQNYTICGSVRLVSYVTWHICSNQQMFKPIPDFAYRYLVTPF
ncbi:hypothetical protein CLAIMM_02541 [Cladophialophora immunda]|nr:hypothetical protein CLAIMM_02541 [Cladophialophora immunda]